jgi:hypothetical protein
MSGLQTVRNADFMALLAKKLSVFMTLKPDEQMCVCALVSVCVRVLCAVTVLYQDASASSTEESELNGLYQAIGGYYLTNANNASTNSSNMNSSVHKTSSSSSSIVSQQQARSGKGAVGQSNANDSDISNHSNANSNVDNSVHSYVNLNVSTSAHSQATGMEQSLQTQLFIEHAVGFHNPQTVNTLTQASTQSQTQTFGAVMIPVFDPLDPLLDLLQAIEKIWVDLQEHTQKIADFEIKFCACRHLLQAQQLAKLVDNTQPVISGQSQVQSASPALPTQLSPMTAHTQANSANLSNKASSTQANFQANVPILAPTAAGSVSQAQSQTQSHGYARRVDPVLRKLVEKEPPQVRRILECACVLRELLAEVRGSILATKQLRVSLFGPQAFALNSYIASTSDACSPSAAHFGGSMNGGFGDDDMNDSWGSDSHTGGGSAHNSSVKASASVHAPHTPFSFNLTWAPRIVEEEDVWEKAEEAEAKRKAAMDEVGWGIGVDISEEDFLNDVNELEHGLEALLRQ